VKITHYNKAIITTVGFVLTVITQTVLPNPSPTWIAIQGAATALVVLFVPNTPKVGSGA
jgi:hypothetical protein